MCKVMEELIQEEKRNDALEMLKDGLSKEKILQYLHLSEEEFNHLTSPLVG